MSGKQKMEELIEEAIEEDIDRVISNIFPLKEEEHSFLNDIELPKENGVKSMESNSPNYHRHHEKLSKKIQELCELTRYNKAGIDFLSSLIPPDVFKEASVKYLKILDKRWFLRKEVEKLKQMEKNLRLIGI